MTKTNKSITKRLKITKSGKMMARKPGQNHFNARTSRRKQISGRKGNEFTMSNKDRSRLLPHN